MTARPAQQHVLQRRERGPDHRAANSTGTNSQVPRRHPGDGQHLRRVDDHRGRHRGPGGLRARSSTTCTGTTRPTSSSRPPTARFVGQLRRRLRQPRVRQRGGRELRAPAELGGHRRRPQRDRPHAGSDAIYPTVDQLLSNPYGTRTDPTTLVSAGSSPELATSSAASATRCHRPPADPHPAGIGEPSASRMSGSRR